MKLVWFVLLAPWVALAQQSQPSSAPVCGDSVVEAGELCDDPSRSLSCAAPCWKSEAPEKKRAHSAVGSLLFSVGMTTAGYGLTAVSFLDGNDKTEQWPLLFLTGATMGLIGPSFAYPQINRQLLPGLLVRSSSLAYLFGVASYIRHNPGTLDHDLLLFYYSTYAVGGLWIASSLFDFVRAPILRVHPAKERAFSARLLPQQLPALGASQKVSTGLSLHISF